jgi:hypothetical protein
LRLQIDAEGILDISLSDMPFFYLFVGGYGRIEKDTVDNDISIGGLK